MAKTLFYEMVPAEAASRFGGLPVLVRDILKLCDGTRTLDAICARSPLSDERTSRVVERLLELGLVQRRSAAKARKRNITPEGTAWIAGERPAAAPIVVVPAPAAIVVVERAVEKSGEAPAAEKSSEPIAEKSSEPIAAEKSIEAPVEIAAAPIAAAEKFSEMPLAEKFSETPLAEKISAALAGEKFSDALAAEKSPAAAVGKSSVSALSDRAAQPPRENPGTETPAPSTNLATGIAAESRRLDDVVIALSDTLVMNAPRFEESAFSAEEEQFFNSSIDHLVQDEFAD